MQIWLPAPLFASIKEAQNRYQRKYGNDLRRIDVLVPPEIYHNICKVQSAFAEDSHKRGKSVLTMSEIVRLMLIYANDYDAHLFEVGKISNFTSKKG